MNGSFDVCILLVGITLGLESKVDEFKSINIDGKRLCFAKQR